MVCGRGSPDRLWRMLDEEPDRLRPPSPPVGVNLRMTPFVNDADLKTLPVRDREDAFGVGAQCSTLCRMVT